MDAHEVARRAAAAMWAGDRASRSLGMEILDVGPGRATMRMTVTEDMVNGHAIGHGGYTFTLADSAFAFACNSYNRVTVAAGAEIRFRAPTRLGDVLTATRHRARAGGPRRHVRRQRQQRRRHGRRDLRRAEQGDRRQPVRGPRRRVGRVTAFDGFPSAALDFYDDLEIDNTKSFWEAHKAVYAAAVKAPMVALTEALAPEFGAAKIFRPYRDVRFAKDKTPYKTHQGAYVAAAPATGWYVEVERAGRPCRLGFLPRGGS